MSFESDGNGGFLSGREISAPTSFHRDHFGRIRHVNGRKPTKAETRAFKFREHPFCGKCGKAVHDVPGGFHFIGNAIRCNECAPAAVAGAHRSKNGRNRDRFARNCRIKPTN